MLQCVAVCCSVLQCVAVCDSVVQCVVVCCSVLQFVVLCCTVLQYITPCLVFLDFFKKLRKISQKSAFCTANLVCLHSANILSKETYHMRDCQKRLSKETYYTVKRDLLFILLKETYHMRDLSYKNLYEFTEHTATHCNTLQHVNSLLHNVQ